MKGAENFVIKLHFLCSNLSFQYSRSLHVEWASQQPRPRLASYTLVWASAGGEDHLAVEVKNTSGNTHKVRHTSSKILNPIPNLPCTIHQFKYLVIQIQRFFENQIGEILFKFSGGSYFTNRSSNFLNFSDTVGESDHEHDVLTQNSRLK